MTVQYSTAVRIARLDSLESVTGVSARLVIYDLSGAAPADTAASITATTLATLVLPSDWMAGASAAGNVVTKAKSGVWSVAASGSGTADFFRVWDSTLTTCHMQGTVTATGGGGDMTVNNASITAGQTVTVDTFTLTAGNP